MAIFGFAAVIAESNVDFPALGKPTRPTSAKIFNSRMLDISIPCCPGLAFLGLCLTEFLKLTFPLPPRPPFNKINSFKIIENL